MELIVNQSQLNSNYEYKVYMSNELIYTAQVNRMTISSFRKINLFKPDGEMICSLKQENWKKLILSKIPIISFFGFSVCPFIYYKNKIKKGYLREKVHDGGYAYGKINGCIFEIWEYTSEYIGIYCDKKQVALISRSRFKKFDEDQYKVVFSKYLEKEIAVIICLLVDVLWHISDTQTYSSTWEYSIQMKARKFDKDWVPED